jgi:hypothetical protein
VSIDNNEATRTSMIHEVKMFKENGADVKLFYHKSNLGCAGHTKWIFEEVFDMNDYDYNIALEEDMIVAKDIFKWCEWAGEETKNDSEIFAISPFTRRAQQKWYPELNDNVDESFYHDHYELGGGFCLHRHTWDYINSLGGMFGAIGPCNTQLEPEEWKKSIMITDKGSFGWVMNKYLRRGKYSLSPMISRTNNVGCKDGLFNPSEAWHYKEVWDERWIGIDKYKDQDLSNIKYKDPIDNRSNHIIPKAK